MMITPPADPIAAVTHPNPYSYYADLVVQKTIYRDEKLGLWVASSAEAVTAVLTSDICRVRPLTEPVPKALLGSPAAEIFRHLVRMNDGVRHCPFKQAVEASLQSIDATRITRQGDRWASYLLDEGRGRVAPRRLQDFAFHLSVYVIGSLLGISDDKLSITALWMGDFVRCLAPASTSEQIERGKSAAGYLLNLFRSLVKTTPTGSSSTLMTTLVEQAKDVGCDDIDTIIANGIGFMSQAYEATAGLIGNTFFMLNGHHDLRMQVATAPDLLPLVIQEVLRYDPPVQNTRRFLASSGVVAGQEMQEGDAVLAVLAAANRDPAANAHPEQFDVLRKDRRIYTFGAGLHACPGDMFSTLIAQAGVKQLLASRHRFTPPRTIAYRPSANVRIALLAEPIL